MEPQHWLMIAAVLVLGFYLGRKYPQLGMGWI